MSIRKPGNMLKAGVISLAVLLSGCGYGKVYVKPYPRPIPPVLTQDEVRQTPATVHRKVLKYIWESQRKFDYDEKIIMEIQK